MRFDRITTAKKKSMMRALSNRCNILDVTFYQSQSNKSKYRKTIDAWNK